MQRLPIATSGFAIALADGYAQTARDRRADCTFALTSPSGELALFAYEYEDARPLEEQVAALRAAYGPGADGADDAAEEPQDEEAWRTAMTTRAGEPCGFAERAVAADGEGLYADFPGRVVRTHLFQSGGSCTRIDLVFEPKARRTADALAGNIMAFSR